MNSIYKNFCVLFPYFWKYQNTKNKFLIVLTLITTISTITLNLSIPFLFKEIVNVLSRYQKSDFEISIILISIYGLCWLLGRFFEKIREMLFFRPTSTAVTEFSLNVFNHLHNQSLKYHLNRETGKISSAIQKAQFGISMFVTNIFFRIMPTIIELILAFFILWHTISFKISFIIILTLICFLILNSFVIKIFKRVDNTYQEIDINVDKRVVDSFLNSENIKFLNAEKFETKIAKKLFKQREKAIVNLFWVGTFSTTSGAMILGIGLTIISYIIGTKVLDGILNISDFVLVNGYLLILFIPLESITGYIRSTVSFSGDISHSIALLEKSQSIKDVPDAKDIVINNAKIEFKNVNFSYNENKIILQNFNLTIPEKSTVAIVGSSGSGKSTISRLLFRFYDIDSGEVLIDNQDIKLVKKDSLRKNIAFVPQDIVLLNKSLKENIIYGNPLVNDNEIEEILEDVHLDNLVKKLPNGLDTIVGERGIKLSGGEKQRIAIARALLKKPKIIVFDEATSSLDTETEKAIQRNITEITTNITTILIAHRLSTVINADKIVVLDKGKIIEEGSHLELIEKDGFYAKLLESQNEKI